MTLAARTAPKAVGIDSLTIECSGVQDRESIADTMLQIAQETGMDFFRADGGNRPGPAVGSSM